MKKKILISAVIFAIILTFSISYCYYIKPNNLNFSNNNDLSNDEISNLILKSYEDRDKNCVKEGVAKVNTLDYLNFIHNEGIINNDDYQRQVENFYLETDMFGHSIDESYQPIFLCKED